MNDIEKKIHEAGQLQRVSKTSDDILEAFEKHHHKRQKKFFFIPAVSTLLTAAAAVAVIFVVNPRPVNEEGVTKGFDDTSSVLTSVVGNLSLNYYYESNSAKNALALDQEEFYQVATEIDSAYPAYSYYNVHQEGLNYSFCSAHFSLNTNRYRYQLSVNNTLIYLFDNISKIKDAGVYEGLISMDDNVYPCEIVATLKNNKLSTVFHYRIDSTLYSISKQTVNRVTTIFYQTSINQEVLSISSVELSSVNGLFTASFKDNDLFLGSNRERTFAHQRDFNTIDVSYKRHTKIKDVEYSGMKLTVDNKRSRTHTYSYEGLEDVVI